MRLYPGPFPTPTGATGAAANAASHALGAGGIDWTTFNQIYLAAAAVGTGLLVAFFNSKYQAKRDTQSGVQASRAEVTTNYSAAMTYMRETVDEVRAEAKAARDARDATNQELRALRVTFRAFGEEALSKNPGVTWSTQSMDTLFNLGVSIASVERSSDRVGDHVARIVEQAAKAADAVVQVNDAVQAGSPEHDTPPGQSPSGKDAGSHADDDSPIDPT